MLWIKNYYMRAIVIIGYPCSGKTTACNYLEKEKDIKSISTGDMVRELAEEEIGEDYNHEELGRFSTKKREEDEAYATKKAISEIRNKNVNEFVIEGVRCKKEIRYIREEIEETIVLYIDVPFEERVRRLKNRGRDGESSSKDLKERDEREKGWGLSKLIEEEIYDVRIDGNCSVNNLYSKIEKVI